MNPRLYFRVVLALPVLVAVALHAAESSSVYGFVVQAVLLVGGTPYLPVALLAWWGLDSCRDDASRIKLLIGALLVYLLAQYVELLVQGGGEGTPSIVGIVMPYLGAAGVLYVVAAIGVYLGLRAAAARSSANASAG